MILITEHGPHLVTLELLDIHRLQVAAPPEHRTHLRREALHHRVTDPDRPLSTYWCTRVLITADSTVYYTPNGVPIADSDTVTLPPPAPNMDPAPRPDQAADALAWISQTISQVQQALARAAARTREQTLVTP